MIIIHTNHGNIMISDIDSELLQYNWTISSDGYAVRNVRVDGVYYSNGRTKYKKVSMQRDLANKIGVEMLDHIDGNKLNYQRENLRSASRHQNGMNLKMPTTNTSGHKGVVYDNTRCKWRAEIRISGKKINLGRFDDINDAIKARRSAEIKYFGEFNREIGIQ